MDTIKILRKYLDRYQGPQKDGLEKLWARAEKIPGVIEEYADNLIKVNMSALGLSEKEVLDRYESFVNNASDEEVQSYMENEAQINDENISISENNLSMLERGEVADEGADNLHKLELDNAKAKEESMDNDDAKEEYIKENFDVENDAMIFPNSIKMYREDARAHAKEAQERMEILRYDLEQQYITKIGGLDRGDSDEVAIMDTEIDRQMRELESK